MLSNRQQQSRRGERTPIPMPSWALPAVVVFGIVLLLFIGWRAFAGPGGTAAADNRRPLTVRPGMYDIRAEFAGGGARRRQQQQQQGQSAANGAGAR